MNKYKKTKAMKDFVLVTTFGFAVIYVVGFLMLLNTKLLIQGCENNHLYSDNSSKKMYLYLEYFKLGLATLFLISFNCLAIFVTLVKLLL
jgi:hypothetical protein